MAEVYSFKQHKKHNKNSDDLESREEGASNHSDNGIKWQHYVINVNNNKGKDGFIVKALRESECNSQLSHRLSV